MKLIKSNRFFYKFNGNIEYKPINNKIHLLYLLHEFGHKHNNDQYLGDGYISKEDIIVEINAFKYAFRCIKKNDPDYDYLIKNAYECISTYFEKTYTYLDEYGDTIGYEYNKNERYISFDEFKKLIK